MDGTRRARLIALSATLACGLTLFTAALLATAQHGGGSPSGADTVARTPMTILTNRPVTTASVVVPRTTPPPTNPAAGTGAVRPLVPAAATTVERS
ncbi:hypothetical protein EV383_0525 [Pseudonocardia sediminis]|uniref:Uncharacterized protein n=1 Tax=Pseudonocardia sediminis TaxID=1397368 RepID=A0A4V2FQ82_PSEST|nr:hypothetical protein [Pseudonocardia sediminis]RZT83710.1 hypothetical protein EV383_0525 [Pseudonocardia sediminis]